MRNFVHYCSFSSVQSLSPVWLCDLMDHSMLGFPVHHNSWSLPKLMSIELVMPSNHLILCHLFSSCPEPFPASGSFLMSWLFASRGQSIGASASASVLPINVQDWFPLGLTSLISLQSKGGSRVFSNTTVQKHQSFCSQLFYGPALTSIHDYWKNHSFDYTELCQQSDVCFLKLCLGLT